MGGDVGKALPPFNQAARTARDAYPLDGMVTQAELDALDVRDITAASAENKPRALPWATSWSRRILRSWATESRSTSAED